jgi:small subunit ribosomal protein S4
MRLLKSKEKKERSLGVRLGLKAHRCNSPKCVMVRRPTTPGMHPKTTRSGSEFKLQLSEKQKIKFSYGLTERQMKNLIKSILESKKNKKSTSSVTDQIIQKLETRLDNVVWRLGFAPSRIVARQLVSHGHFLVNGRKVTIPSFSVKVNDVISVKESSKSLPLFKDLSNVLKGENPVSWLSRNNQKLEGVVKSMPQDVEVPFDINLVVDYYSR